jgi:hypothetical protein
MGRGQRTSAAPFGLTVSNPPTEAQVQATADKLDEVIAALQGESL